MQQHQQQSHQRNGKKGGRGKPPSQQVYKSMNFQSQGGTGIQNNSNSNNGGPSGGNQGVNNSYQFTQGALGGASLTPIGVSLAAHQQQQSNYMMQQNQTAALGGVLGGNVALDPLMHLGQGGGGHHNFGTSHHRNPQHHHQQQNPTLHLSQALSPQALGGGNNFFSPLVSPKTGPTTAGMMPQLGRINYNHPQAVNSHLYQGASTTQHQQNNGGRNAFSPQPFTQTQQNNYHQQHHQQQSTRLQQLGHLAKSTPADGGISKHISADSGVVDGRVLPNGYQIALACGPLKKARYINPTIEKELLEFKEEISDKHDKSEMNKTYVFPRNENFVYRKKNEIQKATNMLQGGAGSGNQTVNNGNATAERFTNLSNMSNQMMALGESSGPIGQLRRQDQDDDYEDQDKDVAIDVMENSPTDLQVIDSIQLNEKRSHMEAIKKINISSEYQLNKVATRDQNNISSNNNAYTSFEVDDDQVQMGDIPILSHLPQNSMKTQGAQDQVRGKKNMLSNQAKALASKMINAQNSQPNNDYDSQQQQNNVTRGTSQNMTGKGTNNGSNNMTKKSALQAMAKQTSANSQQRSQNNNHNNKTISVSSDSISKYNEESMELIPQIPNHNGKNKSGATGGGGKSQSQSSVNAAASKPTGASGKSSAATASLAKKELYQTNVKTSMTGLSAATQKGGRNNKDSLTNAFFGGKQSQQSSTTANAGVNKQVSQGQGEQLFTIVKNQSKDKRKIEIQHNLQRKRDNSMSIRNSNQQNDNININNLTDDQIMLATNSTLEQNLVDSITMTNNKTTTTNNQNASAIINKTASSAGGPNIKQGGAKKFQLKAVDVGNIYKSLKMGQHSGLKTAKNSNLPPTHTSGIGGVKLNSGVRNSSQANRTMANQTSHAAVVDNANISASIKGKSELSNQNSSGTTVINNNSSTVNSGPITNSNSASNNRNNRVQTATGGRSKRFQDHLSKNFSSESNTAGGATNTTNNTATSQPKNKNVNYRISTGPSQQNNSLTRPNATYGAPGRRKSQKIQFAGNQTQPIGSKSGAAQQSAGGKPLVYQSLALQGAERWTKKENNRSMVGNSLDIKNPGISQYVSGIAPNDSALSTTNAAASSIMNKNQKGRKNQVIQNQQQAPDTKSTGLQSVFSPYLRQQDMVSPVAPRITKTASRNNAFRQSNQRQQKTTTTTLNTSIQSTSMPNSIVPNNNGSHPVQTKQQIKQQRNRTQLISPANAEIQYSSGGIVSNMLMASSAYTPNNHGGNALAIGTGGTTTAKEHGKRMFNFTSTNTPAQQIQAAHRTNSLERNTGASGKQNSKGNLLMQSSGMGGNGSGGVIVGSATNTSTGDRIGRYNDLRASFRMQQSNPSSNQGKSLTIGGNGTASRDGVNKKNRTRSKGQSGNTSFVMASSSAHQTHDLQSSQHHQPQTLQNHGRKTPTNSSQAAASTHLRQSLNIDPQGRGASMAGINNGAQSPQVIIDEGVNFSLTNASQPIMFTTGTSANAVNSAVKAKNNQPSQKMFYPQSKDGKPPHPMISSKLTSSGQTSSLTGKIRGSSQQPFNSSK